MNAFARPEDFQLADDFQKVVDGLVKKDAVIGSQRDNDPFVFVMSDASVDRYGDVIEQAGWQLSNFKNNPIALFNHSSMLPIGKWVDVRIQNGALKGRLELLPEGKSARIDELRAMIEAGILRAVSVGFRPLGATENRDGGGVVYKKSELVECSLVSIPANPNALAVAKSLNVSTEAQSLIFGEPAAGIVRRSSPSGVPADPPKTSNSKGRQMSLADRIKAAEANVISLKDQLTEVVNKDGYETDEAAVASSDELGDRIATAERSLASLKKAEAHIGSTSAPISGVAVSGQVFAAPAAKKASPADLLLRGIVCKVQSKVTGQTAQEVMATRYGNDQEMETRLMVDYVARTASAPATTTTSGWASQLVQTSVADFISSLTPDAIYPRLAAKGGSFTFGRNGVISFPSRSATPTVAGSFIAEGAPIPVKQGAFASTTITPRKMAVISTFTREIAEHSTPAIEGLIRTAIQQDTSVAIDTVLMDATASSTTRPAGLRNGASTQAATSGANLAAAITDLKYMVGILAAANSLRSPVWIMNPVNILSLSLQQNSGGDLMFQSELAQGRLLGFPIISSTTQTLATVMLVDAADFVTATGDTPRFDVSDTATLHMEDTTPLAIGTAGSPNTVAAPVRSLFQTDTIGIRMILDINWAMLRTGVIAYVPSVTW